MTDPRSGYPAQLRPQLTTPTHRVVADKSSSSRNGRLNNYTSNRWVRSQSGADLALIRSCSQPLSELQVKELCLKAREILVEEANIQWIDSPVTVG